MHPSLVWRRYLLCRFFQLVRGCSSLSTEEDVDLFLNPLLRVRGVGACAFLIHKTWEVSQLVDKVEELWDIVRDGGGVGVLPLQMFLINLANPLHTLIHRLKVRVRPRLRLCPRLHQQDRVRHCFTMILSICHLSLFKEIRRLVKSNLLSFADCQRILKKAERRDLCDLWQYKSFPI